MLSINSNPPDFASRAVGLLEGFISLDPVNGERSIIFRTADGAEIPGVVHGKAAEAIIANPALLGLRTRVIVYPRTVRNKIRLIIVDVELAGDAVSREADFFLIQGFNLGSRKVGMSQIGIRPNKRSKHQFEKFWLTLHGHLTEELRCVYKVKALRKGAKLFIMESDPILPNRCTTSQKENPPRNTRNLRVQKGGGIGT